MERYHNIYRSLAALLLAGSFLSCGASVDMRFGTDRSLAISLGLEVPEAVDAKLRQFVASALPGSGSGTAPLFNAEAIAESLRVRGALVRSSTMPTPRSYSGKLDIVDIERLLISEQELGSVLQYTRGPGWASIRVQADRGNASTVLDLFPGLDGDLIEALQPPALYDNPVSPAEYRSMLSGLLGRAATTAMDGMLFVLSASFPGTILEASDGVTLDLSKRVARFSIPALDAMVLEKPIVFYIKWIE
ncbi:MAG: hypothetical protein RBT62_04275 [Spirochaetia bacterium]|jgi:hypothetical protein|nr:hypothetical protein [Spirochaetia bacterium]